MSASASHAISTQLAFGSDVPPTLLSPSIPARANRPSLPLPVLVSLPVYNEAGFLLGSVASVKRAMDESGLPYLLSVAEDGSTDSTEKVLEELRATYPELIVRSSRQRLGRGRALRELWMSVDASVYAFIDADLASHPLYLTQAVRAVLDGGDVVTGSRYVAGSRISRPPLRSTVSRLYNWLIRFLTGDSVKDHQCGLKALSRRVVQTVLPLTTEDTWFWDSEILVLAHNKGFRIDEFPVTWIEKKADRTEFSRLWSDIFIHGTGILRLLDEVGRASDSSAASIRLEGVLNAKMTKAPPTRTALSGPTNPRSFQFQK